MFWPLSFLFFYLSELFFLSFFFFERCDCNLLEVSVFPLKIRSIALFLSQIYLNNNKVVSSGLLHFKQETCADYMGSYDRHKSKAQQRARFLCLVYECILIKMDLILTCKHKMGS